MEWNKFFKELGAVLTDELQGEIRDVVSDAKKDGTEFLQRQGELLEKHLQQLAAGEIDKKQFAGYLEDMRDLVSLRALQVGVAEKARYQKFATQVGQLFLNSLLKAVV